ncbi:hypothetical protein D3C72_244860 [compost metagenome]
MSNPIEHEPILLQSMISERMWGLYSTDQDAFKREVTAYFSLGYPDWKIKKASYKTRTVWLERGE